MAKKSGKEISVEKKNVETTDDDMITIPPDGGYGWVVLIACFVSDLLLFWWSRRFLLVN